MAKYKLGNKPEEYELKEDYLGWMPKGEKDWQPFFAQDDRRTELTIIDPNGGDKKVLFLHHFIIRDALPMSFFLEERASNWWSFAIVSEDETSEKFIIPLY